MNSRFLFIIGIIIGLINGICYGFESPVGPRTLVLIENVSIKTSHSKFFASLQEKGFQLTFETSGSRVEFSKYDEFKYDNLILFSPKVNDFGGELSTIRILEFMKSGGNVVIAAAPVTGSAVRDLVYEFGIELDQNGLVLDHFNSATGDDGTHTLIKSNNLLQSSVIFNSPITKPILFQGIAHKIADNPLVISILRGNPTSFSGNPKELASAPFALGKKVGLVSSLQARNNARVTFSGSLELFSNKFFTFEDGDNQKFAEGLVSWTFHNRGVLKHISTFHNKVGESHTPMNYIVKDDIDYGINVLEWNGTQWRPFVADDMQVEFKMLDPYIRTGLKSEKGKFSTRVKLPDVYGVYTFKVEYNRVGYTFLNVADIIPIVPLRHNQYERFIQAAYPYYGSVLSMLIGLFFFSVLFLFSKDPKTQKVKAH